MNPSYGFPTRDVGSGASSARTPEISVSTPQRGAKRKLPRKTKMLLAVSIAVAVTLVNVHAGEKRIRHELTHRFALEDSQFLRTMGPLLGPRILPGNRITALQNGDQIFPAMLAPIRGAREPSLLKLSSTGPATSERSSPRHCVSGPKPV